MLKHTENICSKDAAMKNKAIIFVLLFFVFMLSGVAHAMEILSSPLSGGLGIGTGLRAENQYAGLQPTISNTFSISQDLRWRRVQTLAEWSRWTEHSSGSNQSISHRQDQFMIFGRFEVVRSDWLGLFAGAGLGIQQDRIESSFGMVSETFLSEWGRFWGAEAGLTFYIAPKFEGQMVGRLLSQPYDSRWTQWLGARISYQLF